MLKKLAFEINMSFDIPDSEKLLAKEISDDFIGCINKIKLSIDHLEIMENAFSKAENISEDLLYKYRGLLSRYAKQGKENLQKMQIDAAKAIFKLKKFEIDSNISDLINSVEDTIEKISKLYFDFFELLENVKTNDFKNKIEELISNIKKNLNSLENLIKDRVINYLDENILSKNWIDSIDESKLNPVKKLLTQRDEAISGAPATLNRRQILNPLMQQQMLYPGDRREPKLKEE